MIPGETGPGQHIDIQFEQRLEQVNHSDRTAVQECREGGELRLDAALPLALDRHRDRVADRDVIHADEYGYVAAVGSVQGDFKHKLIHARSNTGPDPRREPLLPAFRRQRSPR